MRKNNKGFTLTEILLTITILVILFALAVPAIFSLQKNLRQKELDDKAQIIYTAVSNRLTELYTSGRSDLYSGDKDYVYQLSNIPGDFASDETYKEDELQKAFRFVLSSDDLSDLISDDTIESSLSNGHYVIEIIPYTVSNDSNRQLTVPSIYAVYYSEEIDVTKEYNFNSGNYISLYRVKKNRLNLTDAKIGYYGGSNPGSSSDTKSLSITSVKINSENIINTAVVKARQANGVDETKLTFEFVFKDEHNNSVTYRYYPSSKQFVKVEGDKETKVDSNFASAIHIGLNYNFEFKLDDLSSDATRFKSLFKTLTAGDDITLIASGKSSDYTVSYSEASDIGNSIFADKGTDKNNTAYISNPRHLQNLDSTSNVSNDYSSATLLNDIDFSSEDYLNTYSKYFNSLMSIYKINTSSGNVSSANVPCFKGINNSNIISFDGNKFSIIGLNTKTALFESNTSTLTIKDLTLKGERIYGDSIAGGLVGTNSGTLKIENCGSYLVDNVDYPTSITADKNLESIRWIYGTNCGGLVGNNSGTLTIDSSFVSSVIGLSDSNATTGGLIGTNSGTITIKKSYADSYLYGKYVGGLIGSSSNSNIDIDSCYTAGFIGVDANDSDAICAGIAPISVNNIKNVYTVMAFDVADSSRSVISGMPGVSTNDSDSNDSKRHSTVINANNFNNLYYMVKFENALGDEYNYKTSQLGSDFNLTGNSSAYKLMGTSLTSYNYHKLNGINHYGDYSASFNNGALVYYEKYSDGSFGFDGAGVEITLKSELTIVGDGYGIAFDSELKNSDKLSINDAIYTNRDYIKSGKYYIYPLSNEEVNPGSAVSDYYKNIKINLNGEIKNYYYNPHFARTVVESSAMPNMPSTVSIRSPRHLYNLSKYYDYYRTVLDNVTYKQERNIDYSSYEWNYANLTNIVNSQNPIGSTNSNPFKDIYDGGSYEINNVSFITNDGFYVGMFGYNVGTLKNVVIAVQYDASTTYKVSRSQAATTNQKVYYGILTGFNSGTISNCAVAGYYLSGSDSTIYGYRNSEVYIGGLVGYNAGTINSCSADNPKLTLVMNSATCYAGSFVGYNTGIISNSYGINMITSTATEGNTNVGGFVGYNSGSIGDSYCATAIISSGTGSNAFSFVPNTSGTVNNCYYLSYGSFQFIDGLYSYNGDSNKSYGTGIIYKDLIGLNSTKALISKYYNLTSKLDNSQTSYPFKAVVKDSDGNYIHYGEWQVYPSLGNFGLFYWEHEKDGNNDGYHITYLGSNNEQLEYQSTLCTAHDDGGIISEYGYGYYVMDGQEDNITTSLVNLECGSVINSDAKKNLEEQIPGLKFFPYTTSTTEDSKLYLKGSVTYGTWTITYLGKEKTETLTYLVNPFFANAFSLKYDKAYSGNGSRFINATPGVDDNKFEIRSADQLQYINWNSTTRNVNQLVDSSNYKQFNFLMYTSISGTGTQTKDGAGNSNRANLNYVMSHDINAQGIKNFTPIAGQGTSSTTSYNAMLYAWFGSSFDGQSYKIQELNINSKSFTVGLFGVTSGAQLQNIILYSTKNATIQRETSNTDLQGAYAIGGLCGIAYDYNNSDHSLKIENCAIAGYQIIDNSKNKLGLGEANIGGLVGVSNISIDKSSSVVDIIIKCTHKDSNNKFTCARWGNYIRVGGISGAVQYNVTNSYSGGSIKVEGEVLKETYDSANPNYNTYVSVDSDQPVQKNYSTHIFLSGIAGSGFAMNYQNFTGNSILKEGFPTVKNCYTYISFPTLEGTIRSITMITSLADRFDEAAGKITVSNCYYLKSSGDIDTRNAPEYYFAGNGSAYWLLNDSYNLDLKTIMLEGDHRFLYYLFTNNNPSSKTNITNFDSKTYSELSSNSMIDTLDSSVWHKVTDSENGQAVDGKYSFNAGNTSLTGKNYPFPTIITQDSKTINVHYGTWPFMGSYWEKGSDAADIFDNIDEDGFAYVEYKFISESNSEIKDIVFKSNDEQYCVVESSEYSSNLDDNGHTYYKVKLKLLKTGSVDIVATWNDNGNTLKESFNLNIKADLKLNISPSTLTLDSGETIKYVFGANENNSYRLSVTSNDGNKDYSNKVSYSESHTMLGDFDAFGTELVDKKELSITSFGYNGLIKVSASYIYNGQTYTTSGIININTSHIIGIKGSLSQYNEYVGDSLDNLKQVSQNYTSTTGPSSDYEFFIYERNSDSLKDLVNNVDSSNIDLTDKDGNNIDNVEIVLKDKTTSTITDNTYNVRGIELYYYSFDDETLDCVLNVPIYKDSSPFVKLKSDVTLSPKRYMLTLDANEGLLDGNSKKEVELTSELFNGDSLSLSNYVPTRNGYDFKGWYKSKEYIETQKVDTLNKTDVRSNITLYAKWTPINIDVQIVDVDGVTSFDTIKCEYDATKVDLSSLTKDGYRLLGLYDSIDEGKIIIDSDGNIRELETYNNLITSTNAILYAKWEKYNTITLNIDGTSYNTYTFKDGNITSIENYNKPTLNQAYLLIGWFDDADKEIFDADGKAISDSGYDLNSNITLNAKFIKYEIVDKFEDGSEYVIVSNNYALTNQTYSTYGLQAKEVSIISNNNISCLNVENIEESIMLWKYDSNKLSISDNGTVKYLYAYVNGWWWNRYLCLQYDTNYSEWSYLDKQLKSDGYGLKYNGTCFLYNQSPSDIDLYKKIITDKCYE